MILEAQKTEKIPEKLWYLDYFIRDPFDIQDESKIKNFYHNQEEIQEEIAKDIGYAIKGTIGNIAIVGNQGMGKTIFFDLLSLVISDLKQTNREFEAVKFVTCREIDEENISNFMDNNVLVLDDCTVFEEAIFYIQRLRKTNHLIISFWNPISLEPIIYEEKYRSIFDKLLFLKPIEDLDQLILFLELRLKFVNSTKNLSDLINNDMLSLILEYSKGIPRAILEICQYIFVEKFRRGVSSIKEEFINLCLENLGYKLSGGELPNAIKKTAKEICNYYIQYQNYIKSTDIKEGIGRDISTINKHLTILESQKLIERSEYDGRGKHFRPKFALFVQLTGYRDKKGIIDEILIKLKTIKSQL